MSCVGISSPSPRPEGSQFNTLGQRSRRRRTMSILSTSSCLSTTSTSSVSSTLLSDPSPASEVSERSSVWGSFVPLTSASNSLRSLAAVRRYRNSCSSADQSEEAFEISIEKSRPYGSLFSRGQSPSKVPLITRTLSTNPTPRPPSPDSSASSINQDVVVNRGSKNSLHPVLARMERSSKFCVQKKVCSTCRKPGRDFPQCGRCQQMWCSRECRLVGGKRHVCPGSK
ncbi:hypothetical protein BKA70DRAFT_1184309 [Coprinopsis sp. MPI-PUGE-AT-0042]|nr:hypothetical protein BKA70DRAFT_1184309 [Coprinopsis sp. MPI-PUGE-AT-0042]